MTLEERAHTINRAIYHSKKSDIAATYKHILAHLKEVRVEALEEAAEHCDKRKSGDSDPYCQTWDQAMEGAAFGIRALKQEEQE